jgi:hypothetical protein
MTIEELSRRLQTFRAKNPSRRFSPELKTEATRVFHDSRMSASGFAREIGVSPTTLKKWLEQNSSLMPKRFQKITVESDLPVTSDWIVHGPYGLRIEGLPIVHLAELIGQLGGL